MKFLLNVKEKQNKKISHSIGQLGRNIQSIKAGLRCYDLHSLVGVYICLAELSFFPTSLFSPVIFSQCLPHVPRSLLSASYKNNVRLIACHLENSSESKCSCVGVVLSPPAAFFPVSSLQQRSSDLSPAVSSIFHFTPDVLAW